MEPTKKTAFTVRLFGEFAGIGMALSSPHRLQLGMGETFDASRGEALPAGTHGTWLAGMKHYVWVKGETIVQFHGDGPWVIKYVNPDDDPRNK